MLYTCDLICWGVASPGVFQTFLSMLECRSGKRIDFYAHRGSGMRSDDPEVVTYADGTMRSGATENLVWHRIWYDRLCRESCYCCGYHSVARSGDITIGDWWGLRRFMPELEDPWGVSCVITSTAHGLSLLKGTSNQLEITLSSVDDVANSAQPMLLHPPEQKGRDVFWSEFYAHGFESACCSADTLGFVRTMKDVVKKTISSIKGTFAKAPDETIVSRAWNRVPKVDFERLETRGEYPIAFVARNRDDDVRRASSSGGMYHALASHVINDLSGVVYGCAFDEELRAIHIRCETMTEAKRCMGSKYSQSDMKDSILQVRSDLKVGRTVLFTGTPCQVAAVRAACVDIEGGISLDR